MSSLVFNAIVVPSLYLHRHFPSHSTISFRWPSFRTTLIHLNANRPRQPTALTTAATVPVTTAHYPTINNKESTVHAFMTSSDTETAHAASAPVDAAANAKPSDSAKAAADGKPLPEGELMELSPCYGVLL